MYARAGIPEFWILDVEARAIEVCRDPAGSDYRDRTFIRDGLLAPLAFPDFEIDVGALLT